MSDEDNPVSTFEQDPALVSGQKRLGLRDLLNVFGRSDKTDVSFRLFHMLIALLVIGLIALLFWMRETRFTCISAENLEEFHEWCRAKSLGVHSGNVVQPMKSRGRMVNPRNVARTTPWSGGYYSEPFL